MAAAAPPTAADAGSARPLFCVSNAHGTTAPNELLHCLGDAIAEAFGVPRDQVLENRPFQGGLIVRLHGHRPLPWMQVEMNRSLYLAEPWFDQSALEVAPRRLEELNGLFLSALELFATQALAD